MAVVPALPSAVKALGGLPLFGWAFSGFMLGWLVGTVGAGLWADARGPRVAMTTGLIGFGAGLVLAGSAHEMLAFLAGRVLQGAGGGAMMAAGYVAITRGYPDRVRPRMMALTASVWIVPAMIGPSLSGAVTEWFGWRFVFWGVAPLVVITASVVLPPLGRFAIVQPFADLRRVAHALCVATGAALLLAIPMFTHLYIAIAAAPLALLLLLPALSAMFPPGTFVARAGLPYGLAQRWLLCFCYFGTEAFIPLSAGSLRHVSPIDAGLSLSAGAVGWISATWILDRIEARDGAKGRLRRMALGWLLALIGIALVAVTLLSAWPFLLAPMGWIIAGGGMGLAYTCGGLLCLAAAPAGREGEVSAQLQVAEALGTASGAGVGGVLLNAVTSSAWTGQASVFAMLASTAFFATLLALRRALSVPVATAVPAP